MSTLHALLFFAGIPLLIFVAITLLVLAPSLAKGPRYRPGQEWDAEPERFGVVPARTGGGPDRQLEEGAAPSRREQATGATAERLGSDDDGHTTGGASASW